MKELTDPAKIKAAHSYNAAADHFDDAPLSFWNKYGSATIVRIGLAEGSKVLDVACGSGASAIPAAKVIGPNGQVIAVDLAENLLELGRIKAAELGLKNVQFTEADMTELDYPDESFDAVICVFGIFFVPDMESLVKELWRMVKPGGKLAITTWGHNLFAPVYEVWREAIKNERPDLYAAFNPWDRISDIQSVANLFHTVGINKVDVIAENGSHELHEPEDWWTIVMGSGFRWTVDKMGPDASMRVWEQNLHWIETNEVKSIETNVIYAIATKD